MAFSLASSTALTEPVRLRAALAGPAIASAKRFPCASSKRALHFVPPPSMPR